MADLPPVPAPVLPPVPLFAAIGNPVRWQILALLSAGEPLPVYEIARRIGQSASLVSKHIAVLRTAGAVAVGLGNLYRIPPQFLVAPCTIDYGHCLLRMPSGGS